MSDRPDRSLVLDLAHVLRELSDRQREMLAVVRRLRVELSDPPSTAALERPADTPPVEPRRTLPVPQTPVAQAPVAQTPVPPAPVPPAPVPPAPVPPAPVPQAPVAQTPDRPLRMTRDYDYFEDLDTRLARIRDDADPDSA
jgi:hypothetical protein